MATDFYCKCHHAPPEGNFIVGREYREACCLDCAGFYDEDGKVFIFNEIEYLWYFSNVKDSRKQIINNETKKSL